MIKQLKEHFPPVGQRIVRSSSAVLICFIIYFLRGQRGIPFYSALAVLQCMQPYKTNSLQMSKQRATGTFIGAFWGLIVILLKMYLIQPLFSERTGEMVSFVLIAIMTGVVIYTTIIIRFPKVSYFSCVVFLSITVMHMTDNNPYLFVCNRILDTLIGIGVAYVVNGIHLPREMNRDILFVSGVDDTLLTKKEKLTPYSLVEMNRLIDEGAMFTVSTNRTPASLKESIGLIHIKLPVIVMDGAALYDIENNSYLATIPIPPEECEDLGRIFDEAGINVFANVIVDDLLVIYYEKLTNEAQKNIYEKLHRSPYRNYVRRKPGVEDAVTYFMAIDTIAKIDEACRVLRKNGCMDRYKVLTYHSKDHPGYAYIKLYNKFATRKNMLKQLKTQLNVKESIVFSSVKGRGDVYIENSDNNKMVKELKRRFEPVKTPWT